jgi:hypothetical protein
MPAALPIRIGLSARALPTLAGRETKGRVAVPMFATARALEGVGRSDAAKIIGKDCQSLRDLVMRDSMEGVAGLFNYLSLKRQIKAAQVLAITLRGSRLAVRFDWPDPC